jgi:hypothetical protein
MLDFATAHKALIERILEGDGRASPDRRRAAFDNGGLIEPLRTLIDKVVNHAYKVTDTDVAAARASGASEDEIFELVVCASIGQATRQYHAARAALEAAMNGREHAPRDPR